jgi:ADP-ribose pyrophosphatase YjhB (NUDIX family)
VIEIVSYSLAVAVMVMDADHKFLLVKSDYRGWEFPGGFVSGYEFIKETAIREVEEETGIKIQLTNFLGVEQDVTKSICIFVFKGEPVNGKLTVSDESEDVGYFTLDEALNMMTLDHFKERMVRCLNEKDIPFLIVKSN